MIHFGVWDIKRKHIATSQEGVRCLVDATVEHILTVAESDSDAWESLKWIIDEVKIRMGEDEQ